MDTPHKGKWVLKAEKGYSYRAREQRSRTKAMSSLTQKVHFFFFSKLRVLIS